MRCFRLRQLGGWFCVIVIGLVVSACGGNSAGSDLPTPTPPADVGTPQLGAVTGPCAGGRLTIGDLDEIDDAIDAGMTEAQARAMEWQPDAVLVAVRVGCELLEPAFHWRATYFSERIQTYFFSDTRETQVAAADGRAGGVLSLVDVSFNDLAISLLRAGYVQTVSVDPGSNVEVRLNSEAAPFGPSNVPDGEILFHVALESRGELVDLFVSAVDGTVYQYPR